MRHKVRFDELNKLDYFEPMAISEDDKTRRRELADLLAVAFLYFFALFEVHREHKSLLDKSQYETLLANQVSDAVSKVTGIDGYMSDHIREMSKEVVTTTFKHAQVRHDIAPEQNTPSNSISSSTSTTVQTESLDSPQQISSDSHVRTDSDEDKDEYWLSNERAQNIANSETNTFLNYTEYLDAKASGRTKKTWLTMMDPKVRDTHEEVEGQTVGIDEFFQVGNSQMKFPHDLSLSPDPKEVINCRCAVEYK